MRAALVHDWFQGYHGSERVAHAILTDVLPSDPRPDVFTFQAAPDVLPPDLAAAITKSSRLADLPLLAQQGHGSGRWRYLLPYMPHYFRSLRMNDYELVVSSSHACALQVQAAPGAKHVCYCHTPMRYAWMPALESGRVTGLAGAVLGRFAGRLRASDKRAAQLVDSFVANSGAVRDRIRRFYGRDAVVIHPPVDVDGLVAAPVRDEGHFLWVHRLVDYKRPELVVEAFRELPHYRLTMVGVGPLEERVRASLPANVELLGWLDQDRLNSLFSTACGFIHVGVEDFGISMVEALASGAPVVALNEGGAAEIVGAGIHGELIDEATVPALRAAVQRVVESDWDTAALVDHARSFSRERFASEFSAHIEGVMSAAAR